MKQEDLLKALIKELFAMNTLHQEYQDNDTHFVIDSLKEGNTLILKITLKENKDKEEFENWLAQVDDNLFSEVLEELGEAYNLDAMYNSPDYKEVISRVKAKTKELASKKIAKLKKLL